MKVLKAILIRSIIHDLVKWNDRLRKVIDRKMRIDVTHLHFIYERRKNTVVSKEVFKSYYSFTVYSSGGS